MSRHALVTGAEGFVGSLLRSYLIAQSWEVTGTVRTPDPANPDLIACDICEAEQVEDVVSTKGPFSHTFHLAALSHVPDAMRHPIPTVRVNLEGLIHVASVLRKFNPESRLIYIGSSEVYGKPKTLPITEESPLNPANPYAISKAAADAYCRYLAASESFDAVCVRPFNHTGPGQTDQFVLPSFARQLVQIEIGRAPAVLRVGNLNAARDFLHVNDVIRAYEAIALHGRKGEAYNVCSGQSWTIQESLNRMIELARAEVSVEVDHDRVRPVDIPEMRGSHEKLTRETGWKPQIGFSDLLSELLTYWREKEAIAH